MAIAETAELVATLKLKDQLSGPAKGATRSVQGLERAATSGSASVAKAESGMGRLGRTAGLLGTKLGNAKRSLTGLITGPLGIIGLGAGLFSLGHIIEDSVGEADALGKSVFQLSKLTGLSAERTSALLAVMGKYGVSQETAARSLGFLEKNLGTYTATAKKAAKFDKEFGFSLLDRNKHVKDANTLILQAADYFNNRLIPASKKALLESKLFGRGWQQLLPVLALGRKGIIDAEAAAKEFGLTLTSKNVQELAAYRQQTRELGDAMGGLKLQIGLAVVPALGQLAQAATKFISSNRRGIVDFFKNGTKLAEQIGKAVGDYVIPAFSAIGHAWNSLPEPLRNVLIGGFVANKVVGKVFGTSIVGMLKPILGLAGGKGLFGRGNSPAAPLYVQAVGGLGAGAGGVGAGGGGLKSKLGSALGLIGIVGDIASVVATQQQISAGSTQQAADIASTQKKWLAKSPSTADLIRGLAGVQQGINDIRSNPLNVLVQGDALTKLEGMRADLQKQIALQTRGPKPTLGSMIPALIGHADERNKRDPLTPQKMRAITTEGNRGLAKSRDLHTTGYQIAMTVRNMQGTLASLERSGFGAVVSVLWAVQAAIKGIPSMGTMASQTNRGTGPEGRIVIPNPAGGPVGIEKNRGRGAGGLNLTVNASISARETTHATTVAARYGTNATSAGAR